MNSFKKRYKSINSNVPYIIVLGLLSYVFFITIGFSSLSSNLSMSAAATVRVEKDIRVSSISASNTTHSAYSNWEDYNVSGINASVALPNSNSTVTYDVVVTNIGNTEMGILSITGLPSNLTYSISNYDLKDTLCDDNNSTKCDLGAVTTLHVTIGYKDGEFDSNNVTHVFNMNFEFKQVYSISYSGFASTSGLPTTILDGETKTITFTSGTGIPVDVSVDNATGNYSRSNLTLSNVTGNVTVTRNYSVTYSGFDGDTSGLTSIIGPTGGTITFNSTTGAPEMVEVTGATYSYNADTHVLTLTSVTSDVTITMVPDGIVEIKSITKTDSLNVTENSSPEISSDGQNITFDLGVNVDASNIDQDFYVKYAIVINNDSVHEQKVLSTNFTPRIVGSGNLPNVTYTITDADNNPVINTTIAPKTSETYYLTINIEPQEHGTWGVEGETSVDTAQNGVVSGSISGSNEGDLRGSKTTAKFTASVSNTFDTAKTFNFSIDDSKFSIVDSNGNAISSMNIAANTTDTYDFYIKNLNGNDFISSPYELNVNLNYDSKTSSVGIVSLLVDTNSSITDDKPPVISNVTAKATSTEKEILVTFSGTDDDVITNYYVETYSSDASGNGTRIHTETLSGAANGVQVDYTATVPNDDAYYYFKVYGKDKTGNIATSQEISSCSTGSGYCSRTANEKYKWNFVVTLVLTNAVSSTGTVSTDGNVRTYTINATYDSNISATLSGSSTDYNAPRSISTANITYANGTTEALPSGNSGQTAYSYNNGTLNIYHITGDITIEATGSSSCFAEGTKILMADGSYKNVEDIGYDDLLAVWNYDTGKLTYEYPLWIENEHVASEVIRVTFSDNSYIDFVGDHAVYSLDKKLFVNILDSDNFKVGTHVAKIKNNKLVSTTVKSIKTIKKEVKYYFAGSTTYYNIFANDVLTTDRNLMISNLYGFDDNAKWPKEKEIALSDQNNLLDYSYFEDVLPYYLYKGFRVREAGYLINNNMVTLDLFKNYISSLIINPQMIRSPITIDNNRYWMVTTSEDVVNSSNKNTYLRKEGSKYTLPKSSKSNFEGWYNTSDNTILKPGDIIDVNHGIHLRAIYKTNKTKLVGAYLSKENYISFKNKYESGF